MWTSEPAAHRLLLHLDRRQSQLSLLECGAQRVTGIALLASRFLSGAGSGNRGTFLAYTASASTKSDRTRAMALCGGGALIGLTAGPSVQVLFTWLGPQGFSLGPIRFSMFTAPALLAFIINVLCVILLKIFLDDRLDNRGKEEDTVSRITVTGADDDCTISEDLESQTEAPIRADVLAILVCMLTRAARMLITANIESVGSPFSEIMFGFDETEVLRYNSLAQGGIGLLTTIMLAVYAFTNYTKWISERMNCIVAMIALLFFHLITFSYPFLPGSVECPVDANDQPLYSWCESLRPINMYLYYGSWTTIYGIFLPCLNNSLQSLYSLVLGNGRQGTMQGINQAVGSLSRIFGPLVMSTTFTSFGPQATWAVEIFTLTLFLCIWFLAYRRLVPASERRANKIAPVDHSLDLPSKSSSISL
ncbi:Transporter, major facilitator family protein [Aphelenchoides fujianensis]|nr:Transporter, major facilitator family protein [Aphelenchoides fujianensis]